MCVTFLRCTRYFTETPKSGVWKCACQKQLSQKTGSGWSNLFSHIKSHHPEWQQSGSVNQNSITTFVGSRSSESSSKVSGLVDNTFRWIERIVLGMKPFNFVEDPFNRKYSNLKDISTKTVMKYMDRKTTYPSSTKSRKF